MRQYYMRLGFQYRACDCDGLTAASTEPTAACKCSCSGFNHNSLLSEWRGNASEASWPPLRHNQILYIFRGLLKYSSSSLPLMDETFHREVEDRYLAGQSRDFIAKTMGHSGSTVSDSIRERIIGKYGEEKVSKTRQAAQKIEKSGLDPMIVIANTTTFEKMRQSGMDNKLDAVKELLEIIDSEPADSKEVLQGLRECLGLYRRLKRNDNNVQLSELPDIIARQLKQEEELDLQIAEKRKELENSTSRNAELDRIYKTHHEEMTAYLQLKEKLDKYPILRDPNKILNFLNNLAETACDENQVVQKLSTIQSLDKEIHEKIARKTRADKEAKEVQAILDDWKRDLDRIKRTLADRSEALRAVSELNALGISIDWVFTLAAKIRIAARARGILPSAALQEHSKMLSNDFDEVLGLQESIRRYKEEQEFWRKKTEDAKAAHRSIERPALIVRQFLDQGWSEDQIIRMATMKPFSNKENYEKLCSDLATYSSVAEATNASTLKQTALEAKNSSLEDSNRSLGAKNQGLEEANVALRNQNVQLTEQNNELRAKWQQYQIPTRFYDFFRLLSGQGAPNENALLCELEIVKLLQRQGLLDRLGEWEMEDIEANITKQIWLIRKTVYRP